MTYFGFLALFLVLPILLLLAAHARARRRRPAEALHLGRREVLTAIGVHIVLAVLYTTPWDNYLVATHVWTYDPGRVSGILLGYVPLEEYLFFVLEAVLVGLWWWLIAAPLAPSEAFAPRPGSRIAGLLVTALLWAASIWLLLSRWTPGTYLGLILSWALPPVFIQLAVGADVLRYFRALVAAVIVPLGVYLSIADALAIQLGIWNIDSRQVTGMHIAGLPLEEGLFFFVTVTLLTVGLTLAQAKAMRARFRP